MSDREVPRPVIGDLVVCSAKDYRERAGLDVDVGLYLAERRRDALVLFPGPQRSAWLPKNVLLGVAPDDPRVIPPPGWARTVHAAARLLEAIELEVETGEDGRLEVRIGTRLVDPERWQALARLADPATSGLRIQPGSMSRIRVVFALPG